MKEKYIDLMEKALFAYSDEHIMRYFDTVRQKSLTEHGFPRLTVNIGILIAHGRRKGLLPLFLDMMEFCCESIPKVKAANDFSVREIICCLWEIEKSGLVPKKETNRWRTLLASIDPAACYTCFAVTPTDNVRNWALFTGVSEYFRQKAGLCDSTDFIELQLLQQMQWFDENGMYCDHSQADVHQPMVYDLVPRGLFSLLLDQGYQGKYRDQIDRQLKKAALFTLKMQSPNGEVPFGGRSNQFLHNEAWAAIIYEYEAKRYEKEKDHVLAGAFKAAAGRSLAVVEDWLNKDPIYHIKNRFPTETQYGCETYAYFDKYMITVSSVLYAAYLICDDSIPAAQAEDQQPCTFLTSKHFHKFFMKSGGYGLEFELNADPSYDANGLGRIHKAGAPSAVCLSCPCPSSPQYTVDIPVQTAFSACSAIRQADGWELGAAVGKYTLLENSTVGDCAVATLLCCFDNGPKIYERYKLSKDGADITLQGSDEIAYALPAFCFDGEIAPEITVQTHKLTITYLGWCCEYTTNGTILDLAKVAANRNGHYRIFLAAAKDLLNIKIRIFPKQPS